MIGNKKVLFRGINVVLLIAMLLLPTVAFAEPMPWGGFVTPVFGLAAAPDGSLLVADSGAGIVMMRKGQGRLFAELPGVTDISPIGRGEMFAVTGGGEGDNAAMLFRVSKGKLRGIADLGAFEAQVNPDGGEVDSNPYDVAALAGGRALVADAGGNDLLIIDRKGAVDWVATFPDELVSTAHAKQLIGCPTPPPGLEFVCELPDMIPAQAVSTSVAVGPDGAYYVSELKGFPGPIGESRVWRVEPDARHVDCGSSSKCSVVLDGFTSIVDLAFGPDGTLYVVEFDEAGFLAVELGQFGLPGLTQGGTINACDTSWNCTEFAAHLPLPIAVAVNRTGQVFAVINALIPGAAQVVPLP
ncbi:MAG: ScyD/ScyE family protein [Anaerolineales bacterium]|nr:ScyD/ScyE family protein [Anaerolineales bacterium]